MAPDTPPRSANPKIGELMARYLANQADSRGAGIGEMPVYEVEPYEAAAFPLVEPRTAWDEAVAAVRLLDPESAAMKVAPPSDWSGLISGLDSIAAVSFAAGNFPQLVRDLPMLLRTPTRSELQPRPAPAQDGSSLESWAIRVAKKGLLPDTLIAVGSLRLARRFDAAAQLIDKLKSKAGDRWQAALANEEAALAWHRGDCEKAAELWAKLPASAPACFNRGMSALFRDDAASARAELTRAVSLLPEDDAWHHLARLYLALAGI